MSLAQVFPGRLAIQQRVLPTYRAPFFDTLAEACSGGLSVFAGLPKKVEQIAATDQLASAGFYPAQNHHFGDVTSPFYQCWQSGILDWLENWQPDALIVEANPRYPSTHQAISWMHHRNRIVLGWGLGVPAVTGLFAGWRRRSRRNFLAKLDGIIAYSHQGADEYLTNGFHPDRVFIAPNAAARRPEIRPTLRPEKVSGKLTVLFVGRLQQRKRIDNLLRACSELPFELQPRLCIVGDGPARQDLETLAAGCYPQTEFPGARFGTDLEQFFSEADLFVLPGTGGLAVQQAMAYGLPVIVAQGDGTQGDLVRPENGWVIPTNDLQALTAALQSALSDLPRLRRMGTESFRIVAEEVNLEHMAESFIHALNHIMSLSQPDAVSCISDQQDA